MSRHTGNGHRAVNADNGADALNYEGRSIERMNTLKQRRESCRGPTEAGQKGKGKEKSHDAKTKLD